MIKKVVRYVITRVQTSHLISHSIVFTEPDGVESRECGVLVQSGITCIEAPCCGRARIGRVVWAAASAQGKKGAIERVTRRLQLSCASGWIAQTFGVDFGASVNV